MIWALHGFTGGPRVWDSLDALQSAQCLTVLGHGRESVAQGHESFPSEVSRLADQLPAGAVHLVGYSLGARLALAIAIQNPARVERLSLIGVHPGFRDEVARDHRVQADRQWGKRLRDEGIESFVDAWQELPLWQSQMELPQAQRDEQREQRLQHDPLQLALAIECLGTGVMPPMWENLSALAMPVQLIVGQRDTKLLEIAQSMLPHLAQGQLDVVEGAGHNPVLENPAACNRLLLAPSCPSRVAL
jgi:2-succinyl-6-hydroxy-2,4-cyclohexadiene-1-carboxylate synthase